MSDVLDLTSNVVEEQAKFEAEAAERRKNRGEGERKFLDLFPWHPTNAELKGGLLEARNTLKVLATRHVLTAADVAYYTALGSPLDCGIRRGMEGKEILLIAKPLYVYKKFMSTADGDRSETYLGLGRNKNITGDWLCPHYRAYRNKVSGALRPKIMYAMVVHPTRQEDIDRGPCLILVGATKDIWNGRYNRGEKLCYGIKDFIYGFDPGAGQTSEQSDEDMQIEGVKVKAAKQILPALPAMGVQALVGPHALDIAVYMHLEKFFGGTKQGLALDTTKDYPVAPAKREHSVLLPEDLATLNLVTDLRVLPGYASDGNTCYLAPADAEALSEHRAKQGEATTKTTVQVAKPQPASSQDMDMQTPKPAAPAQPVERTTGVGLAEGIVTGSPVEWDNGGVHYIGRIAAIGGDDCVVNVRVSEQDSEAARTNVQLVLDNPSATEPMDPMTGRVRVKNVLLRPYAG